MLNLLKRWSRLLSVACAQRSDAAWLAALRIAFGLALSVSMLRFIAYGWIDRLFVTPSFHFKYAGFEWVEPLARAPMYALFWVLAALAVAVAAGLAFRVVAPLLALGLTYIQLLDVSTYLNHYYLAALLAWLLSFSPANKIWSVDAWAQRASTPARRTSNAQAPRDPTISRLWLYLFRFQVALVYTFAGLAKAQSDWLLHAQPLRIWLGASVDIPVIGPLLALEWAPLVFSWCGFLFDATIVGWLLWPKTRPWAYAVVVVFHVLTRLLFPIGMFPVIMVLAALCFFDADWPRRLLRRWWSARQPSSGSVRQPPSLNGASGRVKPLWLLAVGYCAFQLFLPLRHLLYDGNVLWHEQGMRFSWRVMVRAKGGSTTFIVSKPGSDKVWHVNPNVYLSSLQESEMSGQPDLILQLAHHIEADFERRGLGPVEVRAQSWVAFNGRRGASMIDPSLDLTQFQLSLHQAPWILPAPVEPPRHTRIVL
jgi:hypothetical protein